MRTEMQLLSRVNGMFLIFIYFNAVIFPQKYLRGSRVNNTWEDTKLANDKF